GADRGPGAARARAHRRCGQARRGAGGLRCPGRAGRQRRAVGARARPGDRGARRAGAADPHQRDRPGTLRPAAGVPGTDRRAAGRHARHERRCAAMIALVRAELQKLFTTRLWWAMLIAMLLYTGANVGLITAVAGVETAQGASGVPGRDTIHFQQLVWSLGVGATVFTMIVGIVMMTAEYRYQTVTGTFLVTPRRGRVVAAKLLAGVVVGVLYGLATLLLTAAVVIPAVMLSGGEVVLFGEGVPRIMLGVLAALTLYVLFGIGLGALIRNQV